MKIVIIGNHCAGLTAAETIRRKDKDSSITIISNEDVPPYSRCLVNYLISKEKTLSEILFKPEDFYKTNNIDTLFGREAIKIIPEKKEVILDDNTSVSYDKLLIATGGSAGGIDIKGADKKGIFTLRTLDDAKEINSYSENIENAVVYGGGLVGIKSALALYKLGKNVKIIISSGSILSQNIDTEESGLVEKYLESKGIELIKNTQIQEIAGDDKIKEVLLSNGEKRKCGLLVIGKGVKANTGLMADTGIKTDMGIIIDNHCRTSVKDIYAAGDVTQSSDSIRKSNCINALWPLAAEEGRVAAENMLGKDSALRERTSMNSMDIIGLPLISCGLTGTRDKPSDAEVLISKDLNKWTLNKYIIKDNKLAGFVLIGNIKNAGILTTMLRKQLPANELKARVMSGKYDLLPMLSVLKNSFEELKNGN
jgi:nitrite reductase (NADH) large subunit